MALNAGYGERLRAHLFLPKSASPPYQTVVFFPAGDAFQLRSARDMSLAWVDFIIRSGRALLCPVYKGFESGHALRMEEVARQMLPWLDRYLGPVARSSP